MKRLSTLAQLIALYRETKGITSTAELARRTGRTERQIWRAKAELTDANVTDVNVIPPDACVSGNTDVNVIPPPDAYVRVEQRSSRARIESTLRVDTSLEESKKDSGADAPAPPLRSSAGKVYAFDGVNGRLTQEQIERWRQAYPAIPNLLAEVQACDDYYSANPDRLKGKWFFACSSWLLRSNKREEGDKRTAHQRMIDEVCPPEIYRGLL
jgi:hypothetical protein